MALPIVEIIVNQIAAALARITTANGYQVTVAEVYRPTKLGGHDRGGVGNYRIALTLPEPEPAPELDICGAEPVKGWMQPVMMDLLFRPSDASTTAIEQTLNVFKADVVRCLFADPQWQGYAVDTEMTPGQTWIDQDSGECGVSALVEVSYRIKENDPYQLPSNPPAWTRIIDGGAAATAEYEAIIEGNGQ